MAVAMDASAQLEQVRTLYEGGLYLQAYNTGLAAMGALDEWPETAGKILAGRVMGHLGDRRRAVVKYLQAWKQDPTDGPACYYYVYSKWNSRGIWDVLNDYRSCQPRFHRDAEDEASWLALRARIHSALRDFDEADLWIDRALDKDPKSSWVWVEKCHLLEAEDKYAEALQAAEHAMQLRPWYRPAVQATAHLLVQLNRDQEALELLQSAATRLESGDLLIQLGLLQSELHMHAEAMQTWEQAVKHLPLMDKQYRDYLLSRRSDTAYECGDLAQCIELAEQIKNNSFYKSVVERLRSAPESAKKVRLPVGFVRQHHMTCAPATLTAISAFWKMPADHLGVAEAICYDGTPAHSQWRWAEENGFVVREFKVTWEASMALLDRGVPFMVSTVEPSNAHLQAVIGYDERRGILLIRDPSLRQSTEFLAEPFFERYASTGPRGMVIVPRDKAHLIADLELPESTLYDHLHGVEAALQRHQRNEAIAHCEKLEALAPGHRLTLLARRAVTAYDANPVESLRYAEQQLALFPEDANFLLQKLYLLSQLARRELRLQLLEELNRNPKTDPIFWLYHVDELIQDAREHPQLLKRLRKIVRYRPHLAGAFHDLARIMWTQNKREVAVELQRFAACMDDKEERYSETYFALCRQQHRTDEALQMLRNRFTRFGRTSCRPVRSLCWALGELEQAGQVKEVLDQALAWRPDDGELLIYAADVYLSRGEFDTAEQLLQRAKGSSHEHAWLNSAANLALRRGDREGARRCWKALLDVEPTNMSAHRAYARLLAETEGVETAIKHLQETVDRFAHHYGLQQLLVEWLRDEADLSAIEAAIRRMVDTFPTDSWVRRELSVTLARRREFEQALRVAEEARDLDPASTWAWSVLGYVYSLWGKGAEARAAYQQAIRLSIDNDSAIGGLISQSHSASDRRDSIVFIYEQLCQQVTLGDGLAAWRAQAETILDGYTLLHVLFEALHLRPDLWHAWSAVVQQLVSLDRLNRALELAKEATQRFPLLPRVWLDLAEVCRRQFDVAGERSALEQSLRINHQWSVSIRRLADSYEREGDFARAAELLERAVFHEPLDAINHGCLASVYHKLGRHNEAIEQVKTALKFDSNYDWAWSSLAHWSKELGLDDPSLELAKELTVQRPGEARSWFVLAQIHHAAGQSAEALNAVTRALELQPRSHNSRDLYARLLAEMGRFDEAVAAANDVPAGEAVPVELRGRAAWIESQRGNLPRAIEMMEQLLREAPEYWFGLEQLANWYERLERWDDYQRIGQWMVEINPHYAVSYGYRGNARYALGDRAGAKADWKRSIQVDPTYDYGALSLFDLQLEDEEWDDAQATLNTLKSQAPSDYAMTREVQLASRRKDSSTALQLLDTLCRNPQASQWSIRTAAKEASQCVGNRAIDEIMTKYAGDKDANAEIAAVVVEALGARGEWKQCDKLLKSISKLGENWYRATLSYARALADAKSLNRLQRLLRKHWKRLNGPTWTWAYIVELLSDVDLDTIQLAWCRGWEKRPDVRPRTLFFLTNSLRNTYKYAKALKVNEAAVKLAPDETTPIHWLWILLERLLVEGWTEDVEAKLNELDTSGVADFYKGMHALLKSLCRLSRADHLPQGQSPVGYKEACRTLWGVADTEFAASLDHYPTFRIVRHRMQARLAQDRSAAMKALYHRFRAWWIAPYVWRQ